MSPEPQRCQALRDDQETGTASVERWSLELRQPVKETPSRVGGSVILSAEPSGTKEPV